MNSMINEIGQWKATIGFGSNLGDRADSIRAAVSCLSAHDDITVLRTSHLYRTPPWGETNQPSFLNACALVTTSLRPMGLLDACKECEAKIGRQATYRWGPREIDIDVLTFGSEQISSRELTIPHRELMNRAFVLIPLAEIVPNLIPIDGGPSISEAAAAIDRTGVEQEEPIGSNHG